MEKVLGYGEGGGPWGRWWAMGKVVGHGEGSGLR